MHKVFLYIVKFQFTYLELILCVISISMTKEQPIQCVDDVKEHLAPLDIDRP